MRSRGQVGGNRVSVGDTSGCKWMQVGTDKERRIKEDQIVSEFEQVGAGTGLIRELRIHGCSPACITPIIQEGK